MSVVRSYGGVAVRTFNLSRQVRLGVEAVSIATLRCDHLEPFAPSRLPVGVKINSPPPTRTLRDAPATTSSVGERRTTPLLVQSMIEATWANVVEHAADPPGYWGSRGRGFESRRPDIRKGQLGWPFLLIAIDLVIVG